MDEWRWIMGSPEHLQALGKVIVQGAALEAVAAMLVGETHRYLGQDAQPTHRWSWSTLIQRLRVVAADLPASLAERLDSWVGRADEVYRKRNRWTHCEWLLSDDGEVGYLYTARDGVDTLGAVDAEALDDLQLRLGGVTTAGYRLASEIHRLRSRA